MPDILLGALTKFSLPLMKNVLSRLVKTVLRPLGLTVAVSTEYARVYNKLLGPGFWLINKKRY